MFPNRVKRVSVLTRFKRYAILNASNWQFRGSGVFVVCVRLMVLLLFTAHAVLGCCVHHRHQPSCQNSLASYGQPVVKFAHHAKPCAHGCRHHHAAPDARDGASVPTKQHHPHHKCDQPTCTYLASSSDGLQLDAFDLCASLDQVVVGSVGKLKLIATRCTNRERKWCRGTIDPDDVCILQNSWQL